MTDIKPEKDKKYLLPYKRNFGRGIFYETYPFEFIGMRGPLYYFHSASAGLDLLISKKKFQEEILKNNTK